jgi:hypothetical protein
LSKGFELKKLFGFQSEPLETELQNVSAPLAAGRSEAAAPLPLGSGERKRASFNFKNI